MKTHKSVKGSEGEKGLREIQGVGQIPHKQRHNTSWASGKAVTFPTHLQTWLIWVFVWVGVYVMSATPFSDMLTLISWNSWEALNLHSCNITRAPVVGAASQGIQVLLRESRPTSSHISEKTSASRETPVPLFTREKFTCTGRISDTFPPLFFGASWSRSCTRSIFLTFSSVFTRLLLQSSTSGGRLTSSPFEFINNTRRHG